MRALAALLGAAFLAACQGRVSASASGVPSSTEGAGASSVAEVTAAPALASPVPAGTPSPALFRAEVAPAPFMQPDDGGEGLLWLTPGAGTRDRDGRLVLVNIWFDDGSSPPRIQIATSEDGESWDVAPTQLLGDLDIGHPRPGPIPAALVQLDDGSWQLYGWAAADASGSRAWAWRTSAPSLDGPWAIDGTEILNPGGPGTWDSQQAAVDSVLRTDDGYLLLYSGEPPGSTNRGDIGLATSTDGLSWTKFDDPATTDTRVAEGDPVISTGICGAATQAAVEQAHVERLGDGYVALFGGYGADDERMSVFAAVSDDGRSWRCGGSEPLLTGAQLGDGEGIHTISTIPIEDGHIGLIAESLLGDHSELWWVDVRPVTE